MSLLSFRPDAVAAMALLAIGTLPAQAGIVTVLPDDIGSSAVNNQWFRTNVLSGATGTITGNLLPGAGHTGALQFNSPGSAGKIDLQYQWDINSAAANGYTLGNLTALGFDWIRASGTAIPTVAPALRLFYDLDGNTSTTRDQGVLVWEPIYNGFSAGQITTAQWTSSDILGGKFWQITTDPHANSWLAALGMNQTNQINIYNYTLDDWMDPGKSKTAGAVTGDTLTAGTVIWGLNVGIGSGWGGSFEGAIDNVRLGFGGQTTIFNFELTETVVEVPEPATLALVGAGLLLGAGTRRARRA
jgi:hypothetical protein